MESIPEIRLDYGVVRVRKDGRYYVHDFTVFPQWYFEGTYYLPFVRRRPNAEDLPNHEYALAWYNIQEHDFEREQENLDRGFLKDELIEGFIAMRKVLVAKVTEFMAQATVDSVRFNEMEHSMRGMHFASIALRHAAQDFLMTLLTTTSFQRHFLETLACYTYLSVYLPRRVDIGSHPVDTTLMGTITADLLVAQEMKDLGVPVWLVRTLDKISPTMNVCVEVARRGPTPEEGSAEVYPGTIVVFQGRPSAIRNCACQALRIANIHLPHSAYTAQPGDNFHGSRPMPGKNTELACFIANDTNTSFSGIAQGIPQAIAQGTASSSSFTMPAPSSSFTAPASSSSFTVPTSSSSFTMPASSSSPSTPASALTPSTGPGGRRGIQKQDFNHKKFLPVTSPLCPSVIPAWAAALDQVSKDFRDVWDHSGRSNLKGYGCVDPFIIWAPTTGSAPTRRSSPGCLCALFGFLVQSRTTWTTPSKCPARKIGAISC